jgi:NAD(P)-dependent dehydrogenase (short-subunit alcohol dehydrogenase family)
MIEAGFMTTPAVSSYLVNQFGLSGLNAVVIGGTGVLGAAMARALGAAGANVVIAGRDAGNAESTVAEIRDLGGVAEVELLDATLRDDLEGLRDRLAADGRFADILINAAGINSSTPFVEISDEEWDRIFRVNLNSVRLACQVFGKSLLDAGRRGSIINIASLSAITPLSRVFTYSASKAAVLNLTQNLAREWAPSGIRVNAISPGFFPAEQNRKVLTPERVTNIMRHTPMNRFGEPDELAGAVLLLASPVAGRFLTGHNLIVDGGFSAMTI